MRVAVLVTTIMLAIFAILPAKADVEEQGIIDVIATKPENELALLLLQQQKPWTESLEELLKTKLDFYVAVIRTGALIKQKPDLAGKTFRIAVVYSQEPPQQTLSYLETRKAMLRSRGISLVWGNDPVALAGQP